MSNSITILSRTKSLPAPFWFSNPLPAGLPNQHPFQVSQCGSLNTQHRLSGTIWRPQDFPSLELLYSAYKQDLFGFNQDRAILASNPVHCADAKDLSSNTANRTNHRVPGELYLSLNCTPIMWGVYLGVQGQSNDNI